MKDESDNTYFMFRTYDDPRGKQVAEHLARTRLPLPQHWEPRKDQNNSLYFYNEATDRWQWTDPRDPLPSGWQEKRTVDGSRAVYVSMLTGEETHEDPRKKLPALPPGVEALVESRGVYYHNKHLR